MKTRTPLWLIRKKYNIKHNRPWNKPNRCRMCKRILPSVSWNGYCPECGIEKCKRVAKSLHEKKGHYYNRWKIGMKKFIKEMR